MQGFVEDAVTHGAKIALGGERLGNRGWFYAPTVLTDVPETARIMNEEPFGPVAPIAGFYDEAEAIEKANRLPFGLAAYAFTKDGARASRLADAVNTGLFGVNSFTVSLPETPFGGVNDSGYGSEGGIEGLEAFLRTKLVSETGV
jgi:succinate-semialdehyde dehydrogenase/glutarate-semialdehyde dehydrogenase